MAYPLTSAQCQAVITALQAAIASNATVVDVMDPAGGRITYQGPLQLTQALALWIGHYNSATASEAGRSAIAIERRSPV